MLSFSCDYNNGAHPDVLRRLVETNAELTDTYGSDLYTAQAAEKIRHACGAPDADVWFLGGGTQTNTTVIDAMLRTYEGVIAVETGHIEAHEAGAIERSGHKVITLKSHDGRMSAEELDDYMEWFESDPDAPHTAQPGMAYISLPTELGTLYTADELEQLYAVCRRHSLLLFIDGARLGYGIAASNGDLTLAKVARSCDAFYIGGTKQGALCGEAVVFPRGNAPKGFFSIVKQHGALFAKGRLCGVQFDALFTDDLYLRLSRHAIDMAQRLKALFRERNIELYVDSPTNQQFVVLPILTARELAKKVEFTPWGATEDGAFVARFVTSWATTEADIAALAAIL